MMIPYDGRKFNMEDLIFGGKMLIFQSWDMECSCSGLFGIKLVYSKLQAIVKASTSVF